MKRCPQCHRVESDESLKFCRVDGATLISDSSPISSEAGTAQLASPHDASEVHTSILPHHTDANVKRATGPTTALPESHSTSETTKLSKNLRPSILVAIAASLVVIAIGGYLIAGKLGTSGTNKGIESVAVLPFENKSGNADSEYLSDGLG